MTPLELILMALAAFVLLIVVLLVVDVVRQRRKTWGAERERLDADRTGFKVKHEIPEKHFAKGPPEHLQESLYLQGALGSQSVLGAAAGSAIQAQNNQLRQSGLGSQQGISSLRAQQMANTLLTEQLKSYESINSMCDRLFEGIEDIEA